MGVYNPAMRRRRRLSRILLNAATVASLVLCVATLVLWVRSRWYIFAVACSIPRRTGTDVVDTSYRVFGVPGRLGFVRGVYTHVGFSEAELSSFLRPPEWSVDSLPVAQLAPDRAAPTFFRHFADWRFHSLGIYNGGKGGEELKVVEIPYAVLFSGAAMLPALRSGRAWFRRRAAGSGVCPTCGYDLRATPDRCPECGTKTLSDGSS